MQVQELRWFYIGAILLSQACYMALAANVRGNTFNLHVLETNYTPYSGHSICKDRGYDGLAVLSSPEAYHLALNITAPNRFSDSSRITVGLVYHRTPRSNIWADGDVVADDMPWDNPAQLPSSRRPYGRMTGNGNFIMTSNSPKSPILCGNYYRKESYGEKLVGQQPDMQSSSLARKEISSYMKCVFLCVNDGRCRAAEFNFNLSACTTFGAGMFWGFAVNDTMISFVRGGY